VAREIGGLFALIASWLAATHPEYALDRKLLRPPSNFRSGCMPLWPAFLPCRKRVSCAWLRLLEKGYDTNQACGCPERRATLVSSQGQHRRIKREIHRRRLFGADSHLPHGSLSPNPVLLLARVPLRVSLSESASAPVSK
jgi:hypothetical protein